jgi:hypothetical protein
MVRLAHVSLVLAFASSIAVADAPTQPKVGDAIAPLGWTNFPKMKWLYDAPSERDAGGKVVVYWFCTPKVAACTDDLARVIALRDTGRAYIIAYVDGTTSQAKKLDPIRESEGVGRGTVAYDGAAGKLMKALGVAPGPTSIVVGTDGKVALVSTGGDATSLDARDQKVNALIGAIKDYSASYDGPKSVKSGEKFQLTIKVQLASWLKWSLAGSSAFTLSAPADLKCDAKKLAGNQLKVEGQTVTASVTCSASKGNYEAQGRISLGYVDATNNAGVVEDGTTWKFSVAP